MRSMMLGNENTTIVNMFTASQWQELEQQALIYKYMASGVPVPHDLILSVRRSLYNSSLSNQPTSFGGVWDGGFPYNHHQLYQIGGVAAAGGYGRKIDLEPGRCRRTDGKKWRCSKEAYPDSKYCERHMHRGRNRSRKPVESSSTSTLLNHHHASSSSSSSTTISKSISHSDHHAYPPPLSSNIHTTFIDSSAYSHPHQTLKDNIYRPHLQGMKDLGDQDQRSAYFQLTDPYTNTQKMSSSNHHQNYSHFSFQNLKDEQKKEQEQEQEHCYVMGTDFIKPSEELTTSTQKADHETSCSKQPFHHFFAQPNTSTLNPPNPDPNWVEVDQQQQLINSSKAPLSTQDLFQSKPRPYW